MTARYLIDTNVVSELARPRPDRALARRLSDAAPVLAIGAPTWHELQSGLHCLPSSRRKTELTVFLAEIESTIPVLPYDGRAAAWHARERGRLDAKGKVTPFADGQIAAIAATLGLTLVTRNVRDFAAFESVSVERW